MQLGKEALLARARGFSEGISGSGLVSFINP